MGVQLLLSYMLMPGLWAGDRGAGGHDGAGVGGGKLEDSWSSGYFSVSVRILSCWIISWQVCTEHFLFAWFGTKCLEGFRGMTVLEFRWIIRQMHLKKTTFSGNSSKWQISEQNFFGGQGRVSCWESIWTEPKRVIGFSTDRKKGGCPGSR